MSTRRANDARRLALAIVAVSAAIVSASSDAADAKTTLPSSLERYEVVAPTRISRGDADRFPAALALTVTAFGRDFDLDLERHDALFHPEYRVLSVGADGGVSERPGVPAPERCFYRGRVREPRNGTDAPDAPGSSSSNRRSIVAVSVCDGVRGHVITPTHAIQLEPAHAHLHGHAPADEETPGADRLATRVIAFRAEDKKPSPGDEALSGPPRVIDRSASAKLPVMRDARTGGEVRPSARPPNARPVATSFADAAAAAARASLAADAAGVGSSRRRLTWASRQVHLELLVINDRARIDQFAGVGAGASASELAAMHAESIDVVNTVAAIYSGEFSAELTIVLVGQVDWTAGDPVSPAPFAGSDGAEVDTEDLLWSVNQWRGENLASLPAHDAAHLFSGRDFDENTVGLAYQQGPDAASVCDQREYCGFEYNYGEYLGEGRCASNRWQTVCCYHWAAAAVSQVYRGEVGTSAATVAHEIGHQLGFAHDGDEDTDGASCAASGFVMAAVGGFGLVDEWSSCSKATYDATIDAHECLAEGAVAVCGNGVVDPGEDCDCLGGDCAGVDACCDGATCAFVPGATCSARDGCCSSCAIVAAGVECRASVGSCDVAETCDGVDPACPADEGVALGTACQDANGDKGACWGPTCSNRQASCQAFGAAYHGGLSASDACGRGGVFGQGAPAGPFDPSYCTAGLVCFDEPDVCQSSGSVYKFDEPWGPQIGFPCSALGSDGKYEYVCDGGPWGDGYGSRCVSVADATPAPPPPPAPPFPPAPPPAPPAPPWERKGVFGAATRYVELVGAAIALGGIIFLLSAAWRCCYRRIRKGRDEQQRREGGTAAAAAAAPQAWYPGAPVVVGPDGRFVGAQQPVVVVQNAHPAQAARAAAAAYYPAQPFHHPEWQPQQHPAAGYPAQPYHHPAVPVPPADPRPDRGRATSADADEGASRVAAPWDCPACTLRNDAASDACGACDGPRPGDAEPEVGFQATRREIPPPERPPEAS